MAGERPMTTGSMQHFYQERLLRYADGELPARQAREIKVHLESCWQCRTELEELQSLVGECGRYRKNFLQNFLPSPSAPWGDIYAGFAKVDAAQQNVSHFVRLKDFFRSSFRLPVLIPSAAALLVLAALFVKFDQTPSVQAAELLRKAVAAADSRPVRAKRVRITTGKHQIVRNANLTTASDAQATESIRSLFVAANYSWEH